MNACNQLQSMAIMIENMLGELISRTVKDARMKWLDSSIAQDGQEWLNGKFGVTGCIKWLGSSASAKVVRWKSNMRDLPA